MAHFLVLLILALPNPDGWTFQNLVSLRLGAWRKNFLWMYAGRDIIFRVLITTLNHALSKTIMVIGSHSTISRRLIRSIESVRRP